MHFAKNDVVWIHTNTTACLAQLSDMKPVKSQVIENIFRWSGEIEKDIGNNRLALEHRRQSWQGKAAKRYSFVVADECCPRQPLHRRLSFISWQIVELEKIGQITPEDKAE